MKSESWIGIYRKINPVEGELVALFRRPDVLPTRLDLLPPEFTQFNRHVVIRPAPIVVHEGDVTLSTALDLLHAVVNGSDEELGVTLEKAQAFLKDHGRAE